MRHIPVIAVPATKPKRKTAAKPVQRFAPSNILTLIVPIAGGCDTSSLRARKKRSFPTMGYLRWRNGLDLSFGGVENCVDRFSPCQPCKGRCARCSSGRHVQQTAAGIAQLESRIRKSVRNCRGGPMARKTTFVSSSRVRCRIDSSERLLIGGFSTLTAPSRPCQRATNMSKQSLAVRLEAARPPPTRTPS